MSDSRKPKHPMEGQKVPTWIRLNSVRNYIAKGMIALAADQFKLIDPERAKEPQVLAVGSELAQARRELARKR